MAIARIIFVVNSRLNYSCKHASGSEVVIPLNSVCLKIIAEKKVSILWLIIAESTMDLCTEYLFFLCKFFLIVLYILYE